MNLKPFRLERYFAEYEFTAPYLLCCSDCESFTIQELLELEPGAREQFQDLWLGYTESTGDPGLRKEISALYERLSPDQILVHAGAEEAIFNFMQVMLKADDQIIVHAPFYQSLGEVAAGLGAEVVEWAGDPENEWTLDLDILKALLTDRTRVVVVNFPHNPTGFLPDAGFLTELSRLSDEHGFTLFSDEVYRGLEYDPSDRLPSLSEINEDAVSLGVMSKTYGLAGLRIGWIATRNASVYRKMAAFKDYTTICNSGPSEFLAALALRHWETLVRRNLNLIQSNLDKLDAFFAAHDDLFAWRRPKAGPIAFPKYLAGSVDVFCRRLVEIAGVLLLPGSVYREGLNHLRIGFGRRNMGEALEKLEAFLQSKPFPF